MVRNNMETAVLGYFSLCFQLTHNTLINFKSSKTYHCFYLLLEVQIRERRRLAVIIRPQ